MATIDYGHGEQDFVCNAWTMIVYEHAFCQDENPEITGDLIKDAMGKIIVKSSDVFYEDEDGAYAQVVRDYTRISWNATMRALWAMLRTSYDVAVVNNRRASEVPSYDEWCGSLIDCEPDMDLVAKEVAQELLRGLFRSGAAASGKTSGEE